jgi:ribulose 1,5-bisphosphate synthetase/thiazole synthase
MASEEEKTILGGGLTGGGLGFIKEVIKDKKTNGK